MPLTENQKEELLAFLDKDHVLSLINGRWYAFDYKTEQVLSEKAYTTDEMLQLDSRLEKILPELVRLFEAEHKYYHPTCELKYSGLYSVSIKLTLDNWAKRIPHVETRNGQALMVKALAIGDSSKRDTGDWIKLMMELCETSVYIDESSTEITYITGTVSQTEMVRKENITSLYPNWEQRKLVGESLGLTWNALAEYAFAEPLREAISNADTFLPENLDDLL